MAAEVRTRSGPELRREDDYHKDNSKANQEGEDRQTNGQTDWPTCSRVGRNAHMRRVVNDEAHVHINQSLANEVCRLLDTNGY